MSCFSYFTSHRKDVSKVENNYGTRSSGSGREKASSKDGEIGRGKGNGKGGNGPKNSMTHSFTLKCHSQLSSYQVRVALQFPHKAVMK
ncbi:hypothetical protein FEM48_Zijuj04G0206100 [Ziziphus jujuba var. spinosa]|uniref:Uncharacterized protein n=1 Tax=Ziziphus jujuba var. spinosa TaxID=714518 RepID=A0A978VM06_ZIZJJ|nr:hypothetical protein FEM48_Zijuj04G0206100 [Ziziphus jujuba var. spinosa]